MGVGMTKMWKVSWYYEYESKDALYPGQRNFRCEHGYSTFRTKRGAERVLKTMKNQRPYLDIRVYEIDVELPMKDLPDPQEKSHEQPMLDRK